MDEKNNKGSKWWLWFVIPIATLTTWKLFRNTARGANRLTEDLTDSESQAVKFYGYFGVKLIAGVPVSTPVLLDSTKRLIGWLARNINDWAVVQSSFSRLCGGNYTLIQAASNSLNTSDFNAFVSLITEAQREARIFCGASPAVTLWNANRYGGVAAEQFAPNAYVGRCIREDDMYYYYMSWRDGVTYQAPKDNFILK